jgi:hypothetical protein
MQEMAASYSEAIGPVEHEKVKKAVMKHIEAIKAMCGKMDELHESEYGDGKDEEPEEEKDDEEVEDKDDEEVEEGEKDEEVEDEKDDEDESEKTFRKYVLKELKAIKTALKPEPVAEKFSPSEELEIKRLERAINRRLELATRIG